MFVIYDCTKFPASIAHQLLPSNRKLNKEKMSDGSHVVIYVGIFWQWDSYVIIFSLTLFSAVRSLIFLCL
jgi:hypothetical protein